MGKMKLPDITLAQALAIIGWVVAQAVAYGVLDKTKEQLVLSTAATIVAAVWKLADAWIRSARNKVRAAAIAAGQPDPANIK